ncbi:DEKNAAC101003 [Brettanomyces naardenensis]|uniref:DEKNAAC101003 n=1 Tax=Brettanomyces naardenensis TaxID=13370 RepID=A0A448YGX3_BRENA|nr:DEKNAAC101003 [Brettanomyces naardenensis]
MTTNRRVVLRLKPIAYSQHDLDAVPNPPTMDAVYDSSLFTTDEVPYDKRGFKYTPCRPNPFFKSTMYSTTDLPPFGSRLSYTDRSQDLLVSKAMNEATVTRGWRSCRTNVGFREGRWYIEYKLLKANDGESNVRFGIGRKEASLDAPVGYDGYGYGFRDKNGQKIHLSKPSKFLEGVEEFETGDVIGLLVELPDMKVQMEIARKQIEEKTMGEVEAVSSEPANIQEKMTTSEHDEPDFTQVGIIRDAIPIKYRNHLFFEQYEYTSSKPMNHLLYPVTVFGEKAVRDKQKFKPARLPGSRITLYKNGKKKGVAFEGLFAFLPPCSEQNQLNINLHRKDNEFYVGRDDGSLGYYPMVSCYDRGMININTGTELECVPEDLQEQIEKGDIRLLPSRYNEQLIEGYVYDLVDETTNAYLDREEEKK